MRTGAQDMRQLTRTLAMPRDRRRQQLSRLVLTTACPKTGRPLRKPIRRRPVFVAAFPFRLLRDGKGIFTSARPQQRAAACVAGASPVCHNVLSKGIHFRRNQQSCSEICAQLKHGLCGSPFTNHESQITNHRGHLAERQ